MQATVRTFDEVARAGSCFADDGHVIGFESHAVEAGGLLLLRPGQRVRVEFDGAGAVSLITLATF